MAQLKRLSQPSWSPQEWVWVLIGVTWYGICFIDLVRLLASWPASKLPVILLCALMFANATYNIPVFRMKRFDIAHYFFGPYCILLAVALAVIWVSDQTVVLWLFAAYSIYQFYAAAWTYQLWRMNSTVQKGGKSEV